MNLSDSPGRPACPSRASGWSSLTTPWGLPCCVRFPCVHAVATTPAQRLGVFLRSFTQPCQPSPKGLSGRPAHRPFRGLLGVHSRYGLHTRAVTVYRDTLTRGFSHFVTSMTAPVASGWSVAGWDLHPLESAAFPRRTPEAAIGSLGNVCTSLHEPWLAMVLWISSNQNAREEQPCRLTDHRGGLLSRRWALSPLRPRRGCPGLRNYPGQFIRRS
jgi:hypothetical protein